MTAPVRTSNVWVFRDAAGVWSCSSLSDARDAAQRAYRIWGQMVRNGRVWIAGEGTYIRADAWLGDEEEAAIKALASKGWAS